MGADQNLPRRHGDTEKTKPLKYRGKEEAEKFIEYLKKVFLIPPCFHDSTM
jgi:HEPN domain-containing protein